MYFNSQIIESLFCNIILFGCLPSDAILKASNSDGGLALGLKGVGVYVEMKRLIPLKMLSVHSVSSILKSILEKESRKTSGLLSKEHCNALLLLDESAPLSSKGYPHFPLYAQISKKLWECIEYEDFPTKTEDYGLSNEGDFVEKRTQMSEKITPLLTKLKMSWTEISCDEKVDELTSIIKILDIRGLLYLLNIRRTQGSVDSFPPPISILVASFNKKHNPNAKLTVGARALSKHCHRDVTSEWWGVCVGSEEAKNEHANTILKHILEDASWINIHLLPHDLQVIEVRHADGYGARWSYDGTDFRGFLEPQMENGHAAGWKH